MNIPRALLRSMLTVVPAIVAAQSLPAHHEIVSGRITSDSGAALRGARVIVTRSSDRTSRTASSDTDGRFAVDWPDGTGDYILQFSAPGFTTINRRATMNGADSLLVVDVKLARGRAAQPLAPVVTNAQRARPSRDGIVTDPMASDYTTVPQNAARRLDPDLAGNLAAIAALAPGVLPVAGGISVFGLGSGQNGTTLNGVAFAGADIPRDAFTRVRVTSSSYDPASGWYSGARTQVDLVPGDLFTQRNAHLTMDTPAMQSTDAVSAHLGQRYSNFNGSIGGMGQLVDDKWAYNYGLQGGRKSSDFATLSTADPNLLQHVGVSSDSAAALLRLLESARVPIGAVRGAPLGLIDDNVSFIGRIDHIPYDWKTLQSSKTTWGLTGYAKWAHAQGQGLAPTATPAHGGESTQSLESLQAEWSTYFGNGYLADLRTSYSLSQHSSDPYARLPDGRVLVASDIGGSAGAVSNLMFGGNSGLGSSTRSSTWESIADVQLYPAGSVKHRFRLTADTRVDATSQDIVNNGLGTFAFNSLGDLAANAPASFTRTLNAPTRRGSALNSFAALGDVWRVSPSFQLRYGFRAEGNVFSDIPANNPAVRSAFGVRTDGAPNTVGLSPRLGFQYSVPGENGRPLGSLRGGVGEFRNLLDPSLLAGPSAATGLPSGLAQLACYGSAVPTPDWSQYASNPASIPSRCADGAPPSFADAAPTVRLFDRSFTPQRSWRGDLGWSSAVFHSTYSLNATFSHSLNQAGIRDLNFSGVPRFYTGDEGRPVFVNPSSIVASTGALSPVDARRVATFGQVIDGVSDLRSESQQLTFTVRPYLGTRLSRYLGDFDIGYTLSSVRDQLRGFDQSTFGDPALRDWARGSLDARHQFVVQGVIRPYPGWLLFFSGHVQSGMPYTPMIGSDVNGDGLVNDRAFIADPAHAADPAVALGMRALLSTTSVQARACLTRQLGQSAARNSCEAPWSASFNASLRIDGGQVFRNDRMSVTLNFANPLGGIDQLLHGSDHLRGWGTQPAPDPVLLDVRGFNPATNSYSYIVNPRFGATSSALNSIRAPFRVTLDVSIDIAPPQTLQQLDRWLRPGRAGRDGAKVSAADLARRFQRTVPDPYAEVLAEEDSLLLTQTQVSAIQSADARYRGRVDSIWTSMSLYLASLPDSYSASAAYRKSDGSTDDAWEITRLSVQRDFKEILTAGQLTILPSLSRMLYQSVAPVHLRIFPRGN